MGIRQSLGLKRTFRLTTATALVALSAGVAFAGSMSTPILFLGGADQIICVANNVGNATVQVKVKIVGQSNSSSETCILPAGDRDGCQGFLNGQSGFCTVSSTDLSTANLKRRVRASMFTRDTSAPFDIHAVVQAE